MLYILALMHMLVDTVTISTLFSALGGRAPEQALTWILLYNFLAFSTQAITGGLADLTAGRCGTGAGLFRLLRRKSDVYILFAVTGSLLSILSAAIPAGLVGRILLAGIGNSLFHAGGGAYALHAHKGKAAAAGIFVGPGAIGVVIGTFLSSSGLLFATDLGALTVILFLIWILIGRLGRGQGKISAAIRRMLSRERKESVPAVQEASLSAPRPVFGVIAVLFLLAAVLSRAVMSGYPSSAGEAGARAVLMLAVCAAAGKIAGGIAMDRIGAAKVMFFSCFVSTPLLILFPDSYQSAMISLFLIQLAMPVTLVLIYRVMPKYPAFAFGLTASVLFPGVLIGKLSAGYVNRLAQTEKNIFYIVFAAVILILVLISNRLIQRPSKNPKAEV